jgi:predicted transcriptional regulator
VPKEVLSPMEYVAKMVAAGATKTAIARAVGVTDMTILSVSKGTTKAFRKLKKLQRVYDRWKAGTLDLSGKRGKKQIEAPVAKDVPVSKKATVKKTKVAKKPVAAVKPKRNDRPRKEAAVTVPTGFELPTVTEEMVAGVEEQIRRLQAEAKFMKDLIAIRKRYEM